MLPLLLSAFLLARSCSPARPLLSDAACYSGCLNLDTDGWKQPAASARGSTSPRPRP